MAKINTVEELLEEVGYRPGALGCTCQFCLRGRITTALAYAAQHLEEEHRQQLDLIAQGERQ